MEHDIINVKDCLRKLDLAVFKFDTGERLQRGIYNRICHLIYYIITESLCVCICVSQFYQITK